MKAPNRFIEALLNRQFDIADDLLSGGADVNACHGSSGWTALHYVVEDMAVEAVGWLLKNGADPNRKDASGWTPLHLAIDAEADRARQEYTEKGVVLSTAELTSLLLQHGADANAKTGEGETALQLARSVGNSLAVDMLRQYGAINAPDN